MDRSECAPLIAGTLQMSSKSLQVFHIMAFSDLLTPRDMIAVLVSLFKCSIWRAQLVMWPGKPWTLINLGHFSCSAIRGGSSIWYCTRSMKASTASSYRLLLQRCPIIDGLNLHASSHDICLHSAVEFADKWWLCRVRLATAANQVWWIVLPPSLL